MIRLRLDRVASRAQRLALDPLLEEFFAGLEQIEVAKAPYFCPGVDVVKFEGAELAQAFSTHLTLVVVKREFSDLEVQLALLMIFAGCVLSRLFDSCSIVHPACLAGLCQLRPLRLVVDEVGFVELMGTRAAPLFPRRGGRKTLLSFFVRWRLRWRLGSAVGRYLPDHVAHGLGGHGGVYVVVGGWRWGWPRRVKSGLVTRK